MCVSPPCGLSGRLAKIGVYMWVVSLSGLLQWNFLGLFKYKKRFSPEFGVFLGGLFITFS